ncbi:MAG: hypothetical protein CL897_05425 [Dehalococcoidia bacterium]|nr:hypothetical protein [Dehalococcoidia bacterium]|tara:strand:+ start:750 stop:1259 length:510 start_codon:yes stop_codon:yes gene_type:complete
MSLTEFGPVQHLSADAVGQPGQRRFRLRAISQGGAYAFVWLEKEQLSAISEAIEATLEQAGVDSGPSNIAEPDPVFPLQANHELDIRAGRLSLGLNEETRRIVIVGAEGANESDGEVISLEFDFDTAGRLLEQIPQVLAAGRQPCPFCGAPMDPDGHVCPRSNGHMREE